MLTTTSADGTSVRAYDQGQGPAIVLLGPGLDDGTRCTKLANILARRFRVLRLHRRQYRGDRAASERRRRPGAHQGSGRAGRRQARQGDDDLLP